MSINNITKTNRQSNLAPGQWENNFVRIQDIETVIKEANEADAANAALIAEVAPVSGVLKYTALLTQVGTSAPTASVLANTLSAAPVLAYAGVGQYTLTLVGAFPVDKTILLTGTASDGDTSSSIFSIGAQRVSDDVISITTHTASTGAAVDGVISKTSFVIEVYP